jgi:hypothetical protein
MRPSYHPEGRVFDDSKVSTESKERKNPITQLWHVNDKCPEGTIPIRRTKEDDVLRASSVKRYGRKKHRAIPQPRSADPDLINESGHQVKFLAFIPFIPYKFIESHIKVSLATHFFDFVMLYLFQMLIFLWQFLWGD